MSKPVSREVGLRRTTTVTLGVTAASVVAVVAFAGLARAATQPTGQNATTDQPSTDANNGAGTTSQDTAPSFGDGAAHNRVPHASSGGS
jgi:hypothetical protein